jgi:hypothetical protein
LSSVVVVGTGAGALPLVPLVPEVPLVPLGLEPLWWSPPDAPLEGLEEESSPEDPEPGPELELARSSVVVLSWPEPLPWSSPRSCFAPGAGAGAGPLEARETGSAESPIESPEIAFAARAMAPAATTPTMPRRMVRSLSLLVTMGSR